VNPLRANSNITAIEFRQLQVSRSGNPPSAV
jgi:hypothetical protein